MPPRMLLLMSPRMPLLVSPRMPSLISLGLVLASPGSSCQSPSDPRPYSEVGMALVISMAFSLSSPGTVKTHQLILPFGYHLLLTPPGSSPCCHSPGCPRALPCAPSRAPIEEQGVGHLLNHAADHAAKWIGVEHAVGKPDHEPVKTPITIFNFITPITTIFL